MKCPLGHILTYYDGSQPQYTHLRASMLAFAHINLLEMLRRFTPEEAFRVATDSVYVQKSALHRLSGVGAFVGKKKCSCGEDICVNCLLGEEYQPPATPANWRDKGERILAPTDNAAYQPKPEHWCGTKDVSGREAPRYDDPLTRHRLSYLSGSGGSGKTTRAIELFRVRDPLVFTPTHRLAIRDAGQRGQCPDVPQLLPLERADRVVPRKDGAEVHLPRDHLGGGLHGAQVCPVCHQLRRLPRRTPCCP